MRSLFQLGALVLVWASAQLAWADNYPSRPIKVIVPYAAGGFSDQASRIISDAMSRSLGQPMVIDNRAGGGGRIGSDAVTKMAPDGYNLLMTTNGTHTYMAVTEKNLSYDPINDFTPISLIGTYGLPMVINPTVPAKKILKNSLPMPKTTATRSTTPLQAWAAACISRASCSMPWPRPR